MTKKSSDGLKNKGSEEVCRQCGKGFEACPIVVVMAFDEAFKDQALASNKNWSVFPVCKGCHEAPALKGHFFLRAQAAVALSAAGSSSLGG